MRILLLLLLVFSTTIYTQAPDIKITIKPTTISLGQTAVLNWDVKNAEKIYISNIGKVAILGEINVNPESNMFYTIIAEGKSGIISKTIGIEVKSGTKGSEPDIKEFKYPRSYKIEQSLVIVLDSIHRILQDQMEFSILEYKDTQTGSLVFITNKSQKSDLVQSHEKRIGARRIAYLVEVKELVSQPKYISYKIGAFIQYRRRIERTWRIELDESIYQRAMKKLTEEIRKFF